MTNINLNGWIKDNPDFNDRKAPLLKTAFLPKKVSLTSKCPPIYKQGALGSCTAQAVCALFQFTETEQRKAPTDLPSRLFLYYHARLLKGTASYDSGATLRDTIKALQKFGVCREVDWPYSEAAFAKRPFTACYDRARVKRVHAYQRVEQKIYDLKTQIYAENPVVFGISLYESFLSDAVTETGMVPLPVKGETQVGAHAMLLVGYDDDLGCFLARNSWGDKWGVQGHCWIPYTYVINSGLCGDLWTITAVP